MMSTAKRYPVVVLKRIAVEDYLRADSRTADKNSEKVGATFSEVVVKKEFVLESEAKRSVKNEIDIDLHGVKHEIGTSVLSGDDFYADKKSYVADLVVKVKKEPEEVTQELVGYFPDHSVGRNQKSLLLIKPENIKNECCDDKGSIRLPLHDTFVESQNVSKNQAEVHPSASIQPVKDSGSLECQFPQNSCRLDETHFRKVSYLRTHSGDFKINVTGECLSEEDKMAKFPLISDLKVKSSVESGQGRFDCDQSKSENVSASKKLLNLRCNKRPFQCELCPAKFKSSGYLKRHLNIHQNTKPECNISRKTFKRRANLSVHLRRVHSDERPFKCDECPAAFKGKSNLSQHAMVHISERPFECDHCAKKFKSKAAVKSHMTSHNDEKPFECEHCLKKFINKRRLTDHSTMHSGEKPFKCSECSKAFRRKCNLYSHLKHHSSERPFKCDQCPAAFKDRHGLRYHFLVHSSERSFKCNQCPKKFKSNRSLREHMISHSKERPFECNQCPSKFKSKAHLRGHLEIHSGKKPYKCNQCSRSFGQSSSLKSHLRVHTGERPYKCSQCPAKFKQNSTLYKHLKIHSSERLYKCQQCPLTFKQRRSLITHMLSHSDIKLFECDQCSKTFRQSYTLKIHSRVHSGAKPYKCNHCPAEFTQSGSLSSHLIVHSSEKPYGFGKRSGKFEQRINAEAPSTSSRDKIVLSCAHCPLKFGKKTLLKEHLKKHIT